MSLEESMSNLAASNNRLAAALDKYAGVIEGLASANGVAFAGGLPVAGSDAAGGSGDDNTGSDAGSDAGTTTTRKRRTKAEIAADAKAEAAKLAGKTDTSASGEPDPFGDGEPDPFGDAAPAAPKLTADVIRGVVLKVREKNKDHAMALLKHVGVETLAQIPESSYEKVIELAAKVGVTL